MTLNDFEYRNTIWDQISYGSLRGTVQAKPLHENVVSKNGNFSSFCLNVSEMEGNMAYVTIHRKYHMLSDGTSFNHSYFSSPINLSFYIIL